MLSHVEEMYLLYLYDLSSKLSGVQYLDDRESHRSSPFSRPVILEIPDGFIF